MLNLRGDITSVAVLGAHCDDIAIGAGGTLMQLPSPDIHALVLSGAGTEREREERAALQAFCPGIKVTVLDFPDGRIPTHWEQVKSAVQKFSSGVAPDLVLAPHPADAHQDHRMLAEIVPTVFRDRWILGYEILKWESDLGAPSIFSPLSTDIARRKIALLHEHYPSQRGKAWFDEEAFLGLARIRGVQCASRYAEAFYSNKTTISFGAE